MAVYSPPVPSVSEQPVIEAPPGIVVQSQEPVEPKKNDWADDAGHDEDDEEDLL